MNEVSYGAPQPDAAPNMVHDLSGTLAAQTPYSDPAATEALAKSFLTRVQRDIDEQVDLRVQQQLANHGIKRTAPLTQQELGLALGSLGIGIPLSGAAGALGGFPGLALVWVGLIIINVAWSQRR